MKKILTYILLLLLTSSCSESMYDATRTPSLSRRYLRVSTTALDFPASASTKSVDIEADGTPWKIAIPDTWATVNKSSGNSSESVDFSVKLSNSADTSRVCVAMLSADVADWDCSYAITLTQAKAAPYIVPSQTSLTVDGRSQNQRIELSSNVTYKALSNVDWLVIGSYDAASVEFSIQENTTGNARSAQVSLTASGVNTVLSVVQRAANITSTTASLDFPYEASSATVEVEAEASWKAVCSEWIGLSHTFGTAGKSSLTINVPKNASAKARTGFVYLTIDGTNRVEIPVNQGCITFDVSSSNVEFDSFGGDKSVEISSNDSWQVTSCPTWVELNTNSGQGNGILNIRVKENNTTSRLLDKIELATTDNVIKRTITVSQSEKHIDFDAPSLSFSFSEGDKAFSFETDGAWNATKDADWFTLDKTSGAGSATISVHVQENMTLFERNGTINLTIAGQPFNVTVHQECKYLTLSSSAFDFTSAVGHTSVSIASNTSWKVTVKDTPNWLIATPSSGSGNADVTIGVSENRTPVERTGVVEVEIPGVQTYLINIKQTGKYLRTDRASVDFTASGGTIVLNVETDGTYEISKEGTWFGYTKSGDAITIIAPANATGVKRSGNLILSLSNLAEGEYQIVVPVVQISK